MKKFTLLFALMAAVSFTNAQQGLEGVIVEKYYSSNAADSTNAANNSSSTLLHSGSVTYRVFIDMAPGYKFIQMFGNTDGPSATVLHPLVVKTTTDFYNDPNNGQVFPQSNSVVNTKKNTTLIDSWLSVGGVCTGKMGVLKIEDTDGSIGNSNGVLTNNPGGTFGVAINSVVPNAQDGMLPGSPVSPNALGLGNATDVFDQTPGNTFSVTNGAIAGLGGVIGVTPSNMVLVGQFTTDGVICFSLNVQLSNTVTNVSEIFVPNNVQTGEFVFAGLAYCSPVTPPTNTNVATGIETLTNSNETTISIYPNPSKGVFAVSVSNAKESDTNSYSVSDITGRVILNKNLGTVPVRFSEVIDLSNFSDGLYVLNVSLNGIVSTVKIIKE